jgi:hypothetical protein
MEGGAGEVGRKRIRHMWLGIAMGWIEQLLICQ